MELCFQCISEKILQLVFSDIFFIFYFLKNTIGNLPPPFASASPPQCTSHALGFLYFSSRALEKSMHFIAYLR